MRQGITTRYLGPTDTKGGRIKALARKASTSDSGWGNKPELSHIASYDHALTLEARHTGVAKALATKLGWSGLWIGGGMPDERGYQYVCLDVGPGTDLHVHMGNLYTFKEDVDWFYVPAAEA